MPTSPQRNTAIARATTGAVWQMMGVLCLTGSSYVMVMLLARQLGPSAYGVFGVVYSVLLASELVMRLGVPQAITRLVAAGDPRATDIVATGLTINVVANLLVLAVFWSVAPILADVLNVADGTRLFRIASLDLPFFAVYTYASHVLIGRHDFRINAIGTCAYGLTKVAGVVALLVTDQVGVAGALVVNIAASVVGLLVQGPTVALHRLRPTLRSRAAVVGLAAPILLADLGVQGMLGLDLWSLNALGTAVGDEVKGVYAAALSLARVPNLLGFVLATVMIPSIARSLAHGDRPTAARLARGATWFLAAMVLPACAVIASSADDVMGFLFSDAFAPGGKYLALLVFAQGLGFTCLIALQSMLVGAGRPLTGAKCILAALIVAIALNVTLIALFGAVGAAISALASFATAVILSGTFVAQELGSIIELRVVVRAAMASLAVGVLGWMIPSHGWQVLLELVGLGVAYLAIAWLTGILRPEHIQLLLKKQITR